MSINLTGGEVKVIGNCGDVHLFRLNNPVGQDIINGEGTYEAEFVSINHTSSSPIDLDVSEIATGSLSFNVIIKSGFYTIRRLVPRRTLVTIEVEGR